MTELEQRTRERLKANAFMHHVQNELELMETDHAICSMEVFPECRNSYGMIHGGALYTLADNATGIAAHSDGRAYVTQGGSLHFLRNRREGRIRAEAWVKHRGKTTCLITVEITGEDGVVLALGDFTYFRVEPALMRQKKEQP